jgi:hypothetical protein
MVNWFNRVDMSFFTIKRTTKVEQIINHNKPNTFFYQIILFRYRPIFEKMINSFRLIS